MIDILMPNVKNPPPAQLAIVNERNEKITFELPECLEEIKEVHLNGHRLDDVDKVAANMEYALSAIGELRSCHQERRLAESLASRQLSTIRGLTLVLLVVTVTLASYLVSTVNDIYDSIPLP